jgi:hypothetical protein
MKFVCEDCEKLVSVEEVIIRSSGNDPRYYCKKCYEKEN